MGSALRTCAKPQTEATMLDAAIRLRRTLRQLSPNSIVQHTAAQLSWRQNLALDALFSPTASQKFTIHH